MNAIAPLDRTLLSNSSLRSTALCLAFCVTTQFFTVPLGAQAPPSRPEIYQAAIDKIDFLVGEWRGEGWIMVGPGQRESFDSWERVVEVLGGSALLIEGKHFDQDEGGREGDEGAAPVHHAMATVSWSEADQKYRFASALYDRDAGTFDGWVDDEGRFVWQIEVQGRTMRYVIGLDEQGRWVEDGNISMDGGTNWFPFFHMTLERVD